MDEREAKFVALFGPHMVAAGENAKKNPRLVTGGFLSSVVRSSLACPVG